MESALIYFEDPAVTGMFLPVRPSLTIQKNRCEKIRRLFFLQNSIPTNGRGVNFGVSNMTSIHAPSVD